MSHIFVAILLATLVEVPIYIAFKARFKSVDMEEGEISISGDDNKGGMVVLGGGVEDSEVALIAGDL